MCPVNTWGKPGIVMSQTCEDLTFLPSGKLIVSGLVARLLFTTSTPSIIKIDVAPVSAIACVVAIAIALRYSVVCFPNIPRAAAASDVGRAIENSGGWEPGDVQFDVWTVASSSSTTLNEQIWVGSKVSICAVTKSLNLCARSISAPNRQTCPGKIDLCMPRVLA